MSADLIEAIEELRSWSADCKSMQAEKAHSSRVDGDEVGEARHEGRRETYHAVEQMIVETVLPEAEE